MKNTLRFALVGALLSVAAPVASAANCYTVSKQAAKLIAAKPANVLAIVAKQIEANPGCACEVVKAAIVSTEANKKLVAQIVEQAIKSAPKKMNLITKCALSVAPDARNEVVAVATKYARNAGASSVESSKGGVATKNDATEDNLDPLSFVGNDHPTGAMSNGVFVLPAANGGPGAQVAPGNTYSQP